MIQVYKIMHGINDMKRETFFEMAQTDRGTRGNMLKIQKKYARPNIRIMTSTLPGPEWQSTYSFM